MALATFRVRVSPSGHEELLEVPDPPPPTAPVFAQYVVSGAGPGAAIRCPISSAFGPSPWTIENNNTLVLGAGRWFYSIGGRLSSTGVSVGFQLQVVTSGNSPPAPGPLFQFNGLADEVYPLGHSAMWRTTSAAQRFFVEYNAQPAPIALSTASIFLVRLGDP